LARVQIKLPEAFTFSTGVPVRVGDINRGQHVGHLAILSMIEEARARFWQRCGYPENQSAGPAYGFIIADLSVIYLKQVNYGPPLTIKITVGEFSSKGYDILYRISDEKGDEVARAKTGIVVFDYVQQKAAALSEEMAARLKKDYLR
jgi:acyl-CoA thioester hydrolase